MIDFKMAAKMHLAQQRAFSDNTKTKSSYKFSENTRGVKVVPDLKGQDKETVSYLDYFTPNTPVEENAGDFEDSQDLPDMTLDWPVSCGRIGRFCNAKKLETRYRTNSTDSAFSEESFADFDGDESTKLESLIDQLIFTDDRLNTDMSPYVKTEKLPSMDTSILDVGDLFNNTDIFTMDFETLTHESHTSSFLDKDTWPDSENNETNETTSSISSISSTDSGKGSIQKYPTEISTFSECESGQGLNGSSSSISEQLKKLSSGFCISLDEDRLIECDGNDAHKPIEIATFPGCEPCQGLNGSNSSISEQFKKLSSGFCISLDEDGLIECDGTDVHKPVEISTCSECEPGQDLNGSSSSISEQFKRLSPGFCISLDEDRLIECDGTDVHKPDGQGLNGSSSSIIEQFKKLSSGFRLSLDEDGLIECGGTDAHKPVVSDHRDGCVNDCIHECSFVDLSTLLEVNPYGSPFCIGENLSVDSQRHLKTNDHDLCVLGSNSNETDNSDTYTNSNTILCQVTSTKTTSATQDVTTKSNNSITNSNNSSNNSTNENPLTEVDFWPMKDEDKIVAPLSSVHNCPVKCIDMSEVNSNKIVDKSVNDCDEHSEESLCLCSLENLCGYGDQEIPGINHNNNDCNFLSDPYNGPEHRFTFDKNTLIIDSTDGKALLLSPADNTPEIKFTNQGDSKEGLGPYNETENRFTFDKNTLIIDSTDGKALLLSPADDTPENKFLNQADDKDAMDDSKRYNGIKLLNINDSLVYFGDKLDEKRLLLRPEDKSPEIKFTNKTDDTDSMDDSKDFNGIKLLNINDSVVCFGDKLENVKMESYFPDDECSNDNDSNTSKAQSTSGDLCALSNEYHLEGVVDKDHSYKAHIPAYKEITMDDDDSIIKAQSTSGDLWPLSSKDYLKGMVAKDHAYKAHIPDKPESYFPDSECCTDSDSNISMAQSTSGDLWVLSNENHLKGVVDKDHSYKAHIPAYKTITMSSVNSKEKGDRVQQTTGPTIKQNPAKRPLVKDSNSTKPELSIPENNSSRNGHSSSSSSSSSKSEYPGLKSLLEENSSTTIESVFQTSINCNYYASDDACCVRRKIPKFSIINNDETPAQFETPAQSTAILYQVLSMDDQNFPSTTSFSSQTFLPVKSKVKNHHHNTTQNNYNSNSKSKRHYVTCVRQGESKSKGLMSIRMKDERADMKELEKYLRGIIPTDSDEKQDETFSDPQRETSGLFIRQHRPPCSVLKRLLTGEMSTQKYREIDQQFCKNEQLMKKKMKMD